MQKKALISAASLIVASAMGVTPVFAATTATAPSPAAHAMRAGHRPAFAGKRAAGAPKFDASKMPIFGKVTAINGASITVTGRNNTSYTIDAASAKISKDPKTAGALSDITVGSSIMAQGTLTGTNMVAASIVTGMPSFTGEHPTGTRPEQAPGIGGKVASVSGTTFTVTSSPFGMRGKGSENKNIMLPLVTYTVTTDANTKFIKDGAAATLTDVTANESVIVRGTVDQTAYTAIATNVIIRTAPPTRPANAGATHPAGGIKGLFGSLVNKIGGFFHRK